MLKEPRDVAQQRRDEEAAANAARRAAAYAKADERTKMKGKNKPTRRQKKKQMNIIEERKPALRTKLQQEVRGGWHTVGCGRNGGGGGGGTLVAFCFLSTVWIAVQPLGAASAEQQKPGCCSWLLACSLACALPGAVLTATSQAKDWLPFMRRLTN